MSKRAHPSPPEVRDIAAEDRELIEFFLERAWSELGLADNTLASYRLDLEGFARWLGAHASSLARAGREELFRYLGERGAKGGASGKGYKARSNARLLVEPAAFLSRDGPRWAHRRRSDAAARCAEAAAQPAEGARGIRNRRPVARAGGNADRPSRPCDARAHVRIRPSRQRAGRHHIGAGESCARACCASSARAARSGSCRSATRPRTG